MKTIQSSGRGIVNLSDEVYVITGDYTASHYDTGTLVRKISGVRNNIIPGYHFNEDWTTVCRVEAKEAEFIGIRTDALFLISKPQIRAALFGRA